MAKKRPSASEMFVKRWCKKHGKFPDETEFEEDCLAAMEAYQYYARLAKGNPYYKVRFNPKFNKWCWWKVVITRYRADKDRFLWYLIILAKKNYGSLYPNSVMSEEGWRDVDKLTADLRASELYNFRVAEKKIRYCNMPIPADDANVLYNYLAICGLMSLGLSRYPHPKSTVAEMRENIMKFFHRHTASCIILLDAINQVLGRRHDKNDTNTTDSERGYLCVLSAVLDDLLSEEKSPLPESYHKINTIGV